jgi:hypothetical protein
MVFRQEYESEESMSRLLRVWIKELSYLIIAASM